MTRRSAVLFGGSSTGELAASVADSLDWPLARCRIQRFPDGEVAVRIEQAVRGLEVFVVQATAPPVNDHLIELLAFADACRRGGAGRVTAVVPYFGYARSDRRGGRREPIMASLAAQLIEAVGISHVLAIDLHSPAIEGFFRIPVDNLSAIALLVDALRDRVTDLTVIVSPDFGRFRDALEFGRRLGCPAAALHKKRLDGAVTVRGDARPALA